MLRLLHLCCWTAVSGCPYSVVFLWPFLFFSQDCKLYKLFPLQVLLWVGASELIWQCMFWKASFRYLWCNNFNLYWKNIWQRGSVLSLRAVYFIQPMNISILDRLSVYCIQRWTKHTLTFTPTLPSILMCMLLDCGRNPGNLERTHAARWSTCILHPLCPQCMFDCLESWHSVCKSNMLVIWNHIIFCLMLGFTSHQQCQWIIWK